MNKQLIGVENISGTYVFDLRVSNKRLNINRFFWKMIDADWRENFLNDPKTIMEKIGLTEHEQKLILDENWIGLVQHGVNFFVLEKYARVVKKTNLEVYALMKGMSYEEFMKTRRVPEAT